MGLQLLKIVKEPMSESLGVVITDPCLLSYSTNIKL